MRRLGLAPRPTTAELPRGPGPAYGLGSHDQSGNYGLNFTILVFESCPKTALGFLTSANFQKFTKTNNALRLELCQHSLNSLKSINKFINKLRLGGLALSKARKT